MPLFPSLSGSKKDDEKDKPVDPMENIEKGLLTGVALFGALYAIKSFRYFWSEGLKGAGYMMLLVMAGFSLGIAIVVIDINTHPKKYNKRVFHISALISCIVTIILAALVGVF